MSANLMPFRLPPEPRPTRLKLAAIALLGLPAALLVVMALGEVGGGDATGLQHLPEAALLIAPLFLAWRHPRGVGMALLAAALALFVVWLFLVRWTDVFSPADVPAVVWVAFALVLFGLPFLAGWLLFRAGRGS